VSSLNVVLEPLQHFVTDREMCAKALRALRVAVYLACKPDSVWDNEDYEALKDCVEHFKEARFLMAFGDDEVEVLR
jgi:hypothetical protein